MGGENFQDRRRNHRPDLVFREENIPLKIRQQERIFFPD